MHACIHTYIHTLGTFIHKCMHTYMTDIPKKTCFAYSSCEKKTENANESWPLVMVLGHWSVSLLPWHFPADVYMTTENYTATTAT